MKIVSPFLFLGVAALPCQGQQTRVVPASYATDHGNNLDGGFATHSGRYQQLIDGNAFCKNAAVLNQIAYRRDNTPFFQYVTRTVPKLIVRVGYSKRKAATMSTRFALNSSSTPQIVFSGSFILPPNPNISPRVGPWNVVIKFNRPFVYVRALGELLIDIQQPGNTTAWSFYFLDGIENFNWGWLPKFGVGGTFASKERHELRGNTVRIGTTARVHVGGLISPYPTLACIGASKTRFGALRLPFDLAPLGAPGNRLYISLDVLTPMSLAKIPDRWGGMVSLPIPADRRFASQVFYFQAISNDSRSNALGLVFSQALELRVAAYHPSRGIWSYNSASATANNMSGGMITRLGGSSFN